MKKLTMIAAALVLTAGTGAFASGPDKVSKTVKTAFLKNFTDARNVSWKTVDDFSFASFDLNGRAVDAAYDENGVLLGFSREIQLAELPLNISQSLKADYADYKIRDRAIEVYFEGQTFYYVTAEGSTRILKLKCFSEGGVFVEKRTKK